MNDVKKNKYESQDILYQPQWASSRWYQLNYLVLYFILLSLVIAIPILIFPYYGKLIFNLSIHMICIGIILFVFILLYLKYNKFVFTLVQDGFYYSNHHIHDWMNGIFPFYKRERIKKILIVNEHNILGISTISTQITLMDGTSIILDNDDIDNPEVLIQWYYSRDGVNQ